MSIDWSRRQILFGGLLSILPSAMCVSLAHGQTYDGCWVEQNKINDQTGGVVGDELIPNSGIDGLDLALVQTLEVLSTMFGVLPGFVYYRERGEPNAKATNVNLTKSRPDGTVMLGLRLVRDLLKLKTYPDAAVVAVCAHEFAHILSYSNGMISQLQPSGAPPFRAEQFADYMAGYFAGRRKLDQPAFPAVVFATTTQMYGGLTHGTAEQRSSAVQEGFLCAYVRKLEPQAATLRALNYALASQSPKLVDK
jgi:hypothetical protein